MSSLPLKRVTFDLETTMNSPLGNKAHPRWPENYIVMWGLLAGDGSAAMSAKLTSRIEATSLRPFLMSASLLVGQNIKFDLLYCLQWGIISAEELAHRDIWDTQLAEYLLSGQQMRYATLDELSILYGGTLKDSAVTEFFKEGKGADHVPEGMLQEYLTHDVQNTNDVYEGQIKKASEFGMMTLLTTQMSALKATILMEFNGMRVDSTYIAASIVKLSEEIKSKEEVLDTILKTTLSAIVREDWSYSSPKDVSLLFFGGEYKYKVREAVGVYKTTGLTKYKLMDKAIKVEAIVDPVSVKAEKNKLGYYVTDEKVLKNIDTPMSHLIDSLRVCNKQKTTYYEGMRDLIFPGDYIYPNLNHTATKTGRLSCTSPNIQNQTTEGGIKQAYISRWGKDGSLVEFDYAQLEMVALAYLADDSQLINDINDGIDMHEALYKDMYGITPTKEERKWFKRLSFGLVYGAGAKTLAENAGCAEKDAKKFIKVFYTRYPDVKQWHDSIQEEAKACRKISKEVDMETGRPIGKYIRSSPTKRRYVFREYFNDWKKDMSFSPTELKNYPVQGFATGDVVPFMVGIISDALLKSDMAENAKFIMTVHDSMLFDVNDKILDMFIARCYSILKNTTPLVNAMFDIHLPVTLSVGCSVGKDWLNMTERKMK
jgi:DNA polymerase I-like protein with 3'-5' exonuclease and polymerase domains